MVTALHIWVFLFCSCIWRDEPTGDSSPSSPIPYLLFLPVLFLDALLILSVNCLFGVVAHALRLFFLLLFFIFLFFTVGLYISGVFAGRWHHAGLFGVLIRIVRAALLPSSRHSLVAGAYQAHQPDHSFGSEPGRPGEDKVAHSHFQHSIVVPGSMLHQIEILLEKVSFPSTKPTRPLPPSWESRECTFQARLSLKATQNDHVLTMLLLPVEILASTHAHTHEHVQSHSFGFLTFSSHNFFWNPDCCICVVLCCVVVLRDKYFYLLSFLGGSCWRKSKCNREKSQGDGEAKEPQCRN